MNKISDLKVGNKVATKYFGIGRAYFVGNNYCRLEKLERRMGCFNFWQSEIDWQKTTQLNNTNMKELKIEVPQGFEIDKEKSTFEKIVFKEVNKLPLSVDEIPNRRFYLDGVGHILEKVMVSNYRDKNNLSTKKRAEAFLALMQLVELRDAWNGGCKVDWNDDNYSYNIEVDEDITVYQYSNGGRVLNFKSRKLAEKFRDQFKDLILTAKELL